VGYEYNIGKYEVTAGQYTEFLNAVAKIDTYGLYNTEMDTAVNFYGCNIKRSGGGTVGNPYTYSVASDFANRPVNLVNWGDSARFANWLHNGQPTRAQGLSTTEDGAYFLNGARTDAALLGMSRKKTWKWAVTSEDEWYKAAYYNAVTSSYYLYPTSSDAAPRRSMADAPPGNNANYFAGSGDFPIDSGKYTTLVGEFQNSASPYGTFDQGGNVWEWNEAVIAGSYRGLRGGGFNNNSDTMRADYRSWEHPSEAYPNQGFRVSQVPEPASMVMFGLGIAATLLKRRDAGK